MALAANLVDLLRARQQQGQPQAPQAPQAPVMPKPGFGLTGAMPRAPGALQGPQMTAQGLLAAVENMKQGKGLAGNSALAGLLGSGRMGAMWQRPGFGGLGGSFGSMGQPNQGSPMAAMQGLRERGMFGLGGRR